MAVLIVPGVCRFTVEATYAGIQVATIIDMDINTDGLGTNREESIEDQAGVIVNEWSDHVLNWISNDYTANAVSWVDLDSADGSTGSRNAFADEVWPQSGAESNPTTPSNVAMLVTKQVSSGRSSRNGRMFLPGSSATHIQPGDPRRITTTFVTARQADMDLLLAGLNQDVSVPVTYQSHFSVVHITHRDVEGNPDEGEGRHISALVVESLYATQKRRQRP